MFKISTVLLLGAGLITPAVAQQTKAEKKAEQLAKLKSLIESKKFTFQAQNMYPANGGSKYLNADYDLRIAGDTVVSYLPYYGEVYYGAGYNSPGDDGIKFTSTENSYSIKQKNDGGWDILIKPKDKRVASQLWLTIAKSGYADLNVVGNNRQQIRFYGYIKETPQPKKD